MARHEFSFLFVGPRFAFEDGLESSPEVSLTLCERGSSMYLEGQPDELGRLILHGSSSCPRSAPPVGGVMRDVTQAFVTEIGQVNGLPRPVVVEHSEAESVVQWFVFYDLGPSGWLTTHVRASDGERRLELVLKSLHAAEVAGEMSFLVDPPLVVRIPSRPGYEARATFVSGLAPTGGDAVLTFTRPSQLRPGRRDESWRSHSANSSARVGGPFGIDVVADFGGIAGVDPERVASTVAESLEIV